MCIRDSVYAAARVEEVVRARAVEGVAEEVAQDGVAQLLHAAKAAVHPPAEVRVLVQILERIDGRQDGVEDVLDLRVSQSVIGKVTHTLSTLTNYVLLPTYLLDLRVLVDEHERVRHVGVAQVDQGRANPAARGLGLHAVQQRVHGLGVLFKQPPFPLCLDVVRVLVEPPVEVDFEGSEVYIVKDSQVFSVLCLK